MYFFDPGAMVAYPGCCYFLRRSENAQKVVVGAVLCWSVGNLDICNGAERRPAMQRYQPFATKSETESISPLQSLAVPVQFCDLIFAKIR